MGNLPTISPSGLLRVAGTVKNGVRVDRPEDLYVNVFWDPPPQRLTLGQLDAATCYYYGEDGQRRGVEDRTKARSIVLWQRLFT